MLAISVATLDWQEVLLRVVVAAVLGAAIGFEREIREREAGLRTHLLVSVGSALFTIVSAYGFADVIQNTDPHVLVRYDPSRVAAQIVSGIGFLGAGAIIRQGFSIRGLTTAATLWLVAAIGMAAGAGYYSGAVITTLLALLALWPLRIIAFRVIEPLRPEESRIVVELPTGQAVRPLLDRVGEVHQLEIDDSRDRRLVTMELDKVDDRLVAELSELPFVLAVRWRR